MTYAIRCDECEERVWPPAEAEGPGGQSEIAALRVALEHATETGHQEVDVIAGCYYIGDGPRPETFGEGADADEYMTSDRGKLANDVALAIRTLRDQADRLDERDITDAEALDLQTDVMANHLRDGADLLERKQRERDRTEAES